MKVLITGSNGFVAKNLISNLNLIENIQIYEFNRDSSPFELEQYTKDCDFVFHLAGVNRPKNNDEFLEGNYNLTVQLLKNLESNGNKCPIMISSSTQALLDNEYGKSKKLAEEILIDYSKRNGTKIFIYRFPNLFGKWCKPNYNSVVATWCYNVANNLDISVTDEKKALSLCYIDDVCDELIKCLYDEEQRNEDYYCSVPIIYQRTLGEISDLIKSFKANDKNIMVPSTGDDFTKKMYATYISYVPLNEMLVDLVEHRDERGVFCELVRTKECGQVSLSTTNSNIVRGGHYHNTKMERFIVVKGKAKIEFEHVITHDRIVFEVSGDKLQYVTIPVGYQHSINNIGSDELILILWANELFDQSKPDTYVMKKK